MLPLMPVLEWEQAPTGVYKMASAYADCRSQLGPLFDVDLEAAANHIEAQCGPLRMKLQDAVDGLVHRFGESPTDGPVVVFIRALALLGIVRNGKLRLL